MASPSVAEPTKRHIEAVARTTIRAKQDGVFAGVTSGLASAVLGSRLMGFNRHTTIFCGGVTGVISGYLFTQAFLSTALARLQAEETRMASGKGRLGDSALPGALEQ